MTTAETVSSGDDGFTVAATADGRTLTIEVEGDLDLGAGAHWDEVVLPLLDRGSSAVDVDLLRASFMDSSGLGLLVKLRDWASGSGARLRLLNVPHNVMRVLEFSGVVALFDVSAAQLEPD